MQSIPIGRYDKGVLVNFEKPDRYLSPTMRRLGQQYPVLAAKIAGAELFGAPRLNAFHLFSPNELRLSRIIEDLFDPNGSHGQDLLFLNALLSTLKLPRTSIIEPISVRREVVTSTGRQIDLVIEMPRIILGIENKPWAGQQMNQLADYLDTLKGWSRGRTPVLVFLSNKEPETATDEVHVVRLHSNDEPSLNQILSACVPKVRAPRAQAHVEEMIAYLAHEFGAEPMTNDADQIYVDAVEAEFERGVDSRRGLAMAMVSQSKLHALLMNDISEKIISKVQTKFADIELEDEETEFGDELECKDGHWGIRRPHWPKNCSIAISAGKANFNDVYYGVYAPDPKYDQVEEGDGCALHTQLVKVTRSIEGGSKTRWWPWWKWAEPRDWGAANLASLLLASPSGSITDHPRVQDLINRILALAVAVDDGVSLKNI